MKKLPLLDLLCRRYPGYERQRLLALVLCGDVRVNDEKVREPRRLVSVESELRLTAPPLVLEVSDEPPPLPYVSRGGEKLAGLVGAWGFPIAGKVWLDAGSSTGGFTHCLLLAGARMIHAVDVGYNQLDWRLRQHPRVQCHERCNIMGLTSLDPEPDCAVADLSFRSIAGPARKILDLSKEGLLYALVKPQFERKYGTDEQSKNESFAGIVDPEEHRAILGDLLGRLAEEDVGVHRLVPSVLKGTRGNQEYFALMMRGQGASLDELSAGLFSAFDQGIP